jgi:hypothetical protein
MKDSLGMLREKFTKLEGVSAGIAVDYRDKLRNLFTGKVKIEVGKRWRR